MVSRVIIVLAVLCGSLSTQSQDYDSLRQAVISLDAEVQQINLNLNESKRKFQSGILIATLGYTTTIAGGLMLGRENDELGQVLLVAGGVTGVIGTYKLVNAFSFLTREGKKKR